MKAEIHVEPEDVERAIADFIRRKYGMNYRITVRGAPQLLVEVDLGTPVGSMGQPIRIEQQGGRVNDIDGSGLYAPGTK